MSSPANALYEIILAAYTSTKYVNYLAVSGLTMLIADYLHTLPDEIRLMWPAAFSLPKVLFFVVRYYALLHGVFSMTYSLPTNPTADYCSSAFVRVALSTKLTIIASEGSFELAIHQLWKLTKAPPAILLIRVYAFAGRDKALLAFIIIQFIVSDSPF
ncbi:hypothetical protein MD484_g5234, partial [Candolleomyces efflorescens]